MPFELPEKKKAFELPEKTQGFTLPEKKEPVQVLDKAELPGEDVPAEERDFIDEVGMFFKEAGEKSMDMAEELMIGLGFGVTKAGQGVKQSLMMLDEEFGVAPKGSTEAYTKAVTEEQRKFEESAVGQSGAGKTGAVAGEFLPFVAVPSVAAVPGLALRTKIATETLAGSALGHSIFEEEVEDKKVNALIGTAIGAALPIGIAGIAAGAARRQKKGFEQFQTAVQENIGKGYNEANAIKRAWETTKPSRAVQRALSGGKELDLSEAAVNAAKAQQLVRESTKIGRAKAAVGRATKPFLQGLNKTITPVASQLERLGMPKLANALRRNDMDMMVAIQQRLAVKDGFARLIDKVPSNVKRDMSLGLANGDKFAVARAISQISDNKVADDLVDATNRVWNMLDDIHKEAQALGVKLGKVEDYFPRQIADWDKFAAKRGISKSKVKEALAIEINNKHNLKGADKIRAASLDDKQLKEYLTDDEIAFALNQHIYKGKGPESIATAVQHGKRRTRAELAAEDLDDYVDPATALTNYINSMTMKNYTRRFFGGTQLTKKIEDAGGVIKEENLISGLVDDIVTQLGTNRSIIGEELEQVSDLLKARFIGGSKSPLRGISRARNIMYSATLGNPLAAATQLADLGASVYINGLGRTALAAAKSITRRANRAKLEDLGLDAIAHESEHLSKTALMLDKVLRISGFKAVDRLGKETIMNSTLAKARALSKSEKGRQKLVEKYKDSFTGRELQKLMVDLQAGKRATPEIKYVMWHELAKVQPISMSEMPQVYLNHPNGRIAYMLKTFTLKQLDLLRRESFDRIAKGDVLEGTANLVRLGTILGLSNASVEEAKSFITGKDVDFDDAVLASVLRNYGLSEYTLKFLKQGKPIEAAIRLATPPISVFEDPVKDVMEGFENFRTLKHLPPAGKALHYIYNEED